MLVAMVAACIVMMTAALLVDSGYRGWHQIYNNANCESRLGALDTMIALGAIGRKSNKMDYRLYEVTGNTFVRAPASGAAVPDDIITGQAVEFRYWDRELDAGLMNPDVNATAYALFYLDNDHKLNVDYGLYPPGGVAGVSRRTGGNITTVTLAKNVKSVEFSHTAKNIAGDGRGCVRMKLVINDANEGGSTKTTIAATLMRNVWPQ
jgi:hypothetical protein